MAERKVQHFVPQFLLRRFAEPGSERSLALFNFRSSRVIRRAPIRAQAARSYLYGADGNIERLLAEVEGLAASVIAQIAKTKRAPQRWTADHERLSLFTTIQAARGPAAGAEVNATTDALHKATLDMYHAHGRFAQLNLDGLHVVVGHPEVQAIRAAISIAEAGLDLTCALVENEADAEFVLSDLGVVLHNQWRQGSEQAHLGLGAIGLQIFLPIGPRLMVVFYDADTYALRKGKKSGNAVLTKNNEVRELNMLALEDAFENVYFTGELRTAQQITGRVKRSAPRHAAMERSLINAGVDEALVILHRRPSPATLTQGLFRVHEHLPVALRDWNAFVRPLTKPIYDRTPPNVHQGGAATISWPRVQSGR